MAYINDKNLPYLVEKLSNADNIKINNNKHGSRVSTVINSLVTKSDNVTKALEQEIINDSYSFKVGTGDVNVSADVQDGFGEVGIKGVTYQNILGARINPSDGVEKNNNTITFNKVAQTYCTAGFPDSLAQVDKTYTLIFDILENTIENPANGNVGKINIVSYNSGNYFIKYKETGHKKILLKQPATSTGKPYVEFYHSTSGKFVMTTPILLEGDHTNNPNLPSYFEGIVGVGDKSKNLFNGKLQIGGISGGNGANENSSTRLRTDFIEISNTIISTKSYEENLDVRLYFFYDSQKRFIQSNAVNTTNLYSATAPSNTKYIRVVFANKDLNYNFSHSNYTNIQIQEGSAPTEYQPYGTHKIEILSNDINLWDLKNKSFSGFIEGGYGNLSSPDCQNRTSDFIRIKPNTAYTYMTTVDVNSSSHPVSWNAIAWYDENKNYITRSVKTGNSMGVDTIIFTLQSPSNAKYVRVGSRYLESDFSQATLSEGVISEHIPYVEDKTQILLDEPLMRLPNGVCDEITRDGILIRRIGKKIINENIPRLAHNATNSNHNQFVIHDGVITPNSVNHANLLCDKKPCKVENSGNNSVWVYNKTTLVFQMDSTINSVEKMRQWLSQNPTTVYYELSTPIITELLAPCLRIFKDGHITFNTLVAPESTHVVQLNKSAQIERNIKEVQSLDSRVGQLESFYDNMMLETSYKLNLLNYDFEYTKEREDE